MTACERDSTRLRNSGKHPCDRVPAYVNNPGGRINARPSAPADFLILPVDFAITDYPILPILSSALPANNG